MHSIVTYKKSNVIVTVSGSGPSGKSGKGVPAGGLAGEIAIKNSDSDYDLTWSSVKVSDLMTTDQANAAFQPKGSYALSTGQVFSGNISATNLSNTNTGDQTNITGNAGSVTSVAGNITAGSNITLAGAGTTSSPYVINSSSSGGTTPAGSNGQVQFNNSGAFGADTGLAWDNTSKKLTTTALDVVSTGTTGQIQIGDSTNSNYMQLSTQAVLGQSLIDTTGLLAIRAGTSGVSFNNKSGSTGGAKFFDGAATPVLQAQISANGLIQTSDGIGNLTSVNNGFLSFVGNPIISTNLANSNPTLVVNNANTSSTGNIFKAQFGGVDKFTIGATGTVQMLAGSLGISNGGISSASSISILNGGLSVSLTSASTAGSTTVGSITPMVSPTSGTAVFNTLGLLGVFNQTGGANGITRGLYINPTLTAVADYRAIEVVVGKVIFAPLASGATAPTISGAYNNLVADANGQVSFTTGQIGNIRTVFSTATITTADNTVLVDATAGNVVVTVPVTAKSMYNIKKIDSSINTVTIIPASGTIDGAASKIIMTQNTVINLQGNGTGLYIIS